jgi:thymidylate synthase ThyX
MNTGGQPGGGADPSSKEVGKWADEAMFSAEPHVSTTPRVYLIAMNADPLGQIAACANMYRGVVIRGLDSITHTERSYYLEQMQLTKLKMPLEAVTFHFMLENVTRGFTHQLVRQRTAAYAQESMRFAVVKDLPNAMGLPPSLAGTLETSEWLAANRPPNIKDDEWFGIDQTGWMERVASPEQRMRFRWDNAVKTVGNAYSDMVNMGMPAEDARGLMPTNILTRVNYITNLRGLLDHAGNRLCTQAQFEWRLVFAQISQAIRNYKPLKEWYSAGLDDDTLAGLPMIDEANRWQYEAIADLLKPVCYQIGKCAFGAEFDRKCSIRDRVQAHAARGEAPVEWVDIETREWLTDPGAAR